MNEWKPIETAPKDGTRILLATNDYVFEGYWHQYSPHCDGWWKVSDIENLGNTIYPTHWMPLPEPPTE